MEDVRWLVVSYERHAIYSYQRLWAPVAYRSTLGNRGSQGGAVVERSRFLFVPRKQKQWLRETRRFDVRFHDVDDGSDADRAKAARSPMQQDYVK